ncbi:MAG: hypothetical protein AB8B79_16030 [Granulosicoccus sp.]
MTETLLGLAEVLLYGEKVSDMTFKDKKGDPVRSFVRVFGFRYEGNYFSLDTPTIMLLEGNGAAPRKSTPVDIKNALSSDIKEWVCDKSDHSARLDEVTGSIEDILLEAELDAGHAGRVSGGRVSGGRVSGGRVSGGRVSGGKSD